MRTSAHSRAAGRLAVLAVLLAALLLAVPAGAAGAKSEFAPFAQCPLSVITLTDCIHTLSDGGEVKVGFKTVKLSNPFVIQGGAEGAGEEVSFHGAANGETLVQSPQPVPGGLGRIRAPTPWPAWLQQWFNQGMQEGGGKITATIELAAPAAEITLDTERLLTEEGTALGLPVKIRLSSALLGSNCHLGSAARPIQLDFSSGPSGGLRGSGGTVSYNRENTLSTVNHGRLVNGAYEVPRAGGCGGLLSYYLDPLVDIVFGLPSPQGANAAVIEGELQDAQVEAVRAGR